MRIQQFAISALAAGLMAALPLSTAKAQYYCDPFPLAWPFCIAGAAVGTAATIATAPFRPYYYGYPYYYYGYPYYYRAYYPARRHHKRHKHRHLH
jgi:hypothetical protein